MKQKTKLTRLGSMDKFVIEAIRSGNACLAFQPIVEVSPPHNTVLYEALFRVQNGSELISAGEIFAQITSSETVAEIDKFALKASIEKLREHPEIRIAVNISAPDQSCQKVRELIEHETKKEFAICERLTIEITERATMQNIEIIQRFLMQLQGMGITFALDDFGTGQTSLQYFQDFRFDFVKIDGSFVSDIDTSLDKQVILRAIQSICNFYELTSIAEFVETEAEAKTLQDIGVGLFQGYYFGKPRTDILSPEKAFSKTLS